MVKKTKFIITMVGAVVLLTLVLAATIYFNQILKSSNIRSYVVPPASGLGGMGSSASLTNGLVLYYNFSEGSGNVVHDLSGHGNDGSAHTGAAWVSGISGGAILYNNETGWTGSPAIAVPSSPSLSNMSGLTVSAWVKMNNVSGQMYIFSKSSYSLEMTNGNLVFWVANATESFGSACISNAIGAGGWHNLVAIYNGSNRNGHGIYTYIDGLPASFCAGYILTGNLIPSSAPLWIGAYNFNGAVSNIRLYNRVLSPAELSGLYVMGVPNVINVSVSNPILGHTVNETVNLTANAIGHFGVESVVFYVDNSPVGTAMGASPQYWLNFNTTPLSGGPHTVYAIATDQYVNNGISDSVTFNVDHPPLIWNVVPNPTSPVAQGSTSTSITFTTSLPANCRYSTAPGASYGSMTNAFSTSDGISQSATIFGLQNSNYYSYYVRCRATVTGISDPTDYNVSFWVSPVPPVIPSNRSVNWSAAGIPGALPDVNWPICTQGPYNLSTSTQSTTGTISAGSNQLTVASPIDFQVGQGILAYNNSMYIPSLGNLFPLATTITAINGDTITLGEPAYGNSINKIVMHDNSASIQDAINSCPANSIITIPAGVYTLGSDLIENRPLVLRGASEFSTVLQEGPGGGIGMGEWPGDPWPIFETNVTSGFAKGSNTLTLRGTQELSVGQEIIIDELNNVTPNVEGQNYSFVVNPWGQGGISSCGFTNGPNNQTVTTWGESNTIQWFSGADRCVAQINMVIAINGNQVTLKDPLYWNYNASLLPRAVWWANGNVKDVGLENLTLDGVYKWGGWLTSVGWCSYCWADHIAFLNISRSSISWSYSYHSELLNSYIYGSRVADGGYGNVLGPYRGDHNLANCTPEHYGMELSGISSAMLVQNNTFAYSCGSIVTTDGSVSGSVVSYNYVLEQTKTGASVYDPTFNMHSTHAYDNLFEGNIAARMRADNFHGSSSDTTLYRNFLSDYFFNGTSGKIVQAADNPIELDALQTSYSALGNILGSRLFPYAGYQSAPPFVSNGTTNPNYWQYIYSLGYWSGPTLNYTYTSSSGEGFGVGYPSGTVLHSDYRVANTLIRQGNWDAATNDIIWAPGILNHTLPASLYLTSKPSWFGNAHWPPIGVDPTNPTVEYNCPIPAEIAYDQMEGYTVPSCITFYPSNSTNPVTVTYQSSGSTSTSTSTTSTTTTTDSSITSVPTTVSQNNGNSGGNNGGGGGGGGAYLPTVTKYSSGNQIGYKITNITQHNSENLKFNNNTKSINLTVNFITPAEAGITVNGAAYTLTIANRVRLNDPINYTYYAELTNVSYLPVLHSITLLIYAQSNLPVSTTTNTTTTVQTPKKQTTTILPITSTLVSTTILQTLVIRQNLNSFFFAEVGLGVAVIVVGIVLEIKHIRKERKKKVDETIHPPDSGISTVPPLEEDTAH